MIDAVIVTPPADGRVSLIALHKAKLRPHRQRSKRERLIGTRLRNHKVAIRQQLAIGTQDQPFWKRILVHPRSQIHPKFLDRRWLRCIHQTELQSPLGNPKVRLDQKWRE